MEVNEKQTGFEALPEDLVVEIFEYLSLWDQTRLSLCCTRFKSINVSKVRRRFDAIVVFWGDSYQFVNTYDSYKALKKAKCWMHGPNDGGEFELGECDQMFFENARTNALEISVKANNDLPYSLQSKTFKSLQYTSLEIDFAVSEQHNLPLLKSLISCRDLSESSITIKWSRAMFEDIEETKAFLLEFPKVKSLDLTWIYWGENADSLETEVITDDILLYLVDHCAEDLIVGEGDCTLKGLLSVYEKLHGIECRTVQVTVRSEIAQRFVKSVVDKGHLNVVRLGKNSTHEGIGMNRVVLSKALVEEADD